MQTIILHRFCSKAEYDKYMAGEVLENLTNHWRDGKGGSTSIGFCFFEGDVLEWAYRLNGLVSFDVLISVRTIASAPLMYSSGVYAKVPGNIEAGRILCREYCTETYDRESFRLLTADFSFRNNPRFISLEQRLKLFPQKPNEFN